jgi:hypothetical protein
MTRTTLLVACALLSACTIIKVNHGDTNTIEHEGGVEAGKDLAIRACHRAGGQSAEVVSTVNKNADLPPGTGKQLTTFRCVTGRA